ncbi:MAG: DUF3021 domain-containing protein [Lachnospiraceae bacterium]|nr:DUF3021 domain-containing protein [Lachnospiraceae bacterium]
MKFTYRVIALSSIGFGLGVIVGPLITALTGSLSASDGAIHLVADELDRLIGNPLAAFVLQAVVCGIYGAVAMGGSAVYGIEKWSVARCTITHYLMVMIGIYVTGFLLRWFSINDMASLLVMIPIMTVPYFIIWLVNYISYRVQLNEINRDLCELKSLAKEAA